MAGYATTNARASMPPETWLCVYQHRTARRRRYYYDARRPYPVYFRQEVGRFIIEAGPRRSRGDVVNK